MGEIILNWLFLFGLLGSIIVSGVGYNYLAKKYNKNRPGFTLMGIATFFVTLISIVFLVSLFWSGPSWMVAFAMLFASIALTTLLYFLLDKIWSR